MRHFHVVSNHLLQRLLLCDNAFLNGKMKCMKSTFLFLLVLLAHVMNAQEKDTSSTFNKDRVLEKVLITIKKPFIELQIDKTVINVQTDINAIGSSAFEILQKAPGINITADDAINMSGKAGVTVMIDGRPTQMGSKELANFLRSLPGSTIEKIELITNPSSRFDAQGNAGIINIRLKKNKIKGTNGNITAGYTQQQHYRSSGSFNINHRQEKINFFANTGFNNNLQHTDGNISRIVKLNSTIKKFDNTTVDIDRNVDYNLRTGIDYYINKKSTLGFLFSGNGSWNPFNTPGITSISSNNIIDSSLATTNDNLYKNNRYNANLNYSYEDTIGNELNIDADYTHFKNTNVTNLATDFLDKNFSRYNNSANNLDIGTSIDIYAVKVDYIKQLLKIKGKVESGIKMSNVSTDNKLFATTLLSGVMKADTGRSNQFNYSENIFAAYANFGQQLNKFEYQVGFRIEKAIVNGTSIDLRKNKINNPDTSYINLFPTAFVSYKQDDKHMFALSYSKRINRPDYQSLNPFETIYDIYTSEKGNPFLRPQYTNNVELKYTYRNALNVAIGYNHTKDYSQNITTQKGQQTFGTIGNIGSLDNSYVSINAPLPITKWWEGYANITVFYNHYNGILPDGKLDEKTFGMNYYIQQNFSLGKGWSTQLSSWFNAATQEAIFKTSSLGSLDIGVRKNILKDKGSVRLTVKDLFNTQRWKQTVQFANMDFAYNRKWESRGIRLQFSWSFGKGKYKTRERETNEDANRIKTKN